VVDERDACKKVTNIPIYFVMLSSHEQLRRYDRRTMQLGHIGTTTDIQHNNIITVGNKFYSPGVQLFVSMFLGGSTIVQLSVISVLYCTTILLPWYELTKSSVDFGDNLISVN